MHPYEISTKKDKRYFSKMNKIFKKGEFKKNLKSIVYKCPLYLYKINTKKILRISGIQSINTKKRLRKH